MKQIVARPGFERQNNIIMNTVYRNATKHDARHIAELITTSSDGVAVIEWQTEADKRGNCSALVIGTETYQKADGNYSYKNCLVAEIDGQVAGMLLAFAMPDDCVPRTQKTRPTASNDNVFAPYMYLEEPHSWYICGVAAYPEYRGQGIGSHFMQRAEQQARENGLNKLSLIVFEQKPQVVNFYKRLGYQIIDQAPVVPHPLIPFTGNALLMVKSV